MSKMSLSLHNYQDFRTKFSNGEFGQQRFGQAFYNHFKLERITNQSILKNLYESDGDDAKQLIGELFEFV